MILDYFCFMFPSKNLVEIPFRCPILELACVTSFLRTCKTIETATSTDATATATDATATATTTDATATAKATATDAGHHDIKYC